MHGTIRAYRRGNEPDLRRIGLNPDHWYPLALATEVKKGKTLAVTFAGEPIVLVRTESGRVYALEDRCAHRQMPLSCGVVTGEHVKCCYHAWTFNESGRCTVPYLPKGAPMPHGVRAYPSRERYGFVFVFPGDATLADQVPLPELPDYHSRAHRTMLYSRETKCHYSFLHENLMDMNHQFLHRRVTGRIKATHLETRRGSGFVEVDYRFEQAERSRLASRLLAGGAPRRGDAAVGIMTIRTQYPYQYLQLRRIEGDKPIINLWAAYVPIDRAQRANHTCGLLMVRKPPIPGLMHLAWPLFRRFTEAVFAEDRFAVEAEQRAYDQQGADWNQEVLPFIHDLRALLVRHGVPIEAERADSQSYSAYADDKLP
jgi:phenylpropionate dioxygenase-like ring-hydroxylating dioxygenase large terminal subunit